MRWERLFGDLEAQLAAQDAAELAGEVAERTRLERSRVELSDRFAAWRGQSVSVHLAGDRTLAGRLRDAAREWILLDGPPLALVPTTAVQGVTGLGAAASTADRDAVARRYGLAAVLRVVARDRSPVQVELVDGRVLSGTVDDVGADYLDLAEHPADELRRPAAVQAVRCLPFGALACLRPSSGASSL